MRRFSLLVVLCLALSACGGNSGEERQTAPGDETTTTRESSASSDESDENAAPDFELALADGTQFRLSDEKKPVYLVFWAEW